MLELTLKHVKALSTLLEQQQQKIIALQQDLQISKLSLNIVVDVMLGATFRHLFNLYVLFSFIR